MLRFHFMNYFAKVTGFGGTTKVAKQVPNVVINHNITTRFDTNVAKGLFWILKWKNKNRY
jgi:cytochrome c oxidase assembly protein subunit 11